MYEITPHMVCMRKGNCFSVPSYSSWTLWQASTKFHKGIVGLGVFKLYPGLCKRKVMQKRCWETSWVVTLNISIHFQGWLLCSDEEWALGSVEWVVPVAWGNPACPCSLGSHTLQPGPRVPVTLTPPHLIHEPSLLSQAGCPLGDFWGCYGSKIDNSHLKRQFSVAQEDQHHPSCPHPIGARVYDHHIYFSCIFQKSL